MKALSDYDGAMQRLCGLALDELRDFHGYSEDKALELLTLYLHMFFDEELSKLLPVQNRDKYYIHHEGFIDLALAVHYSLTLKKEPDSSKFRDWSISARQGLTNIYGR